MSAISKTLTINWKRALKRIFKKDLFSIQFSDYGAASVAKVTYSLSERSAF